MYRIYLLSSNVAQCLNMYTLTDILQFRSFLPLFCTKLTYKTNNTQNKIIIRHIMIYNKCNHERETSEKSWSPCKAAYTTITCYLHENNSNVC